MKEERRVGLKLLDKKSNGSAGSELRCRCARLHHGPGHTARPTTAKALWPLDRFAWPHEANRTRAAASGQKNLSLNDELTFGEREVKRLLKDRNPYVSLILYNDFQRLNTPAKVIYPR
jgi:hypothetical protein